MRRLVNFLTSVVFMLLVAASAAQAGEVDSLTQTPSGANTNFAITGTYTASTPTTPFSLPGAPYSLTFTLATTPSSLAFVDTTDDLFGIDATVMVNSVSFSNSQIVFFGSAVGGGLIVCLSQACNPTTLAPNYWDILGEPLFSGSLSNPTFISGTATIDLINSGYQISPTPEPASLLLLATGLVGLGAALRFRHS